MMSIQKRIANSLMSKTLWIGACLLSVAGVRLVYGSQPHESGITPTCAVLEGFLGEVQVFDASRTHVRDTVRGMRLQCGDWVSVGEGKADLIVLATEGRMTLVSSTFAQVQDPLNGPPSERANLSLFRGEAFVSHKGELKNSDIRVITAQAMVKFQASEGYVIAQSDEEETQLLGVSGQPTIENRFIESHPITVPPAQYSRVWLGGSRVIPFEPRYVAAEQLRERLNEVEIPDSKVKMLVAVIQKNFRPQLPTKLESDHPVVRSLASVEAADPVVPPGGVKPNRLLTPEVKGEFSVKKVAKKGPGFRTAQNRKPAQELKIHLKHAQQEKSERATLVHELSQLSGEPLTD